MRLSHAGPKSIWMLAHLEVEKKAVGKIVGNVEVDTICTLHWDSEMYNYDCNCNHWYNLGV